MALLKKTPDNFNNTKIFGGMTDEWNESLGSIYKAGIWL